MNKSTRVQPVLYYSLVALLVLLPFHALLTVRLNSHWVDSWKEALLLIMSLGGVVWLATNKKLLKRFVSTRLNQLVIAFVIVNVVSALLFTNKPMAEAVGLRTNLAFLVVFLLAWLVGSFWQYKRWQRLLPRLLLLPAIVVALLGLFQIFFPDVMLSLFGNNAFIASERPYQFIQDGLILRINSSLWGPSQLGSYLVLPICLVFWLRLRLSNWRFSALLGALLVCLYASQSRGSWVATAIGTTIVIFVHWRHKLQAKTVALAVGIGVIIMVFVLALSLRINTPLSNVLFHSKNSLALTQSSNTDHVRAMKKGVEQWQEHWLGSGPGSAGPASSYNAKVLYTESFYLQLLVETSLWGLGLFLSISYLVLRSLYKSVVAKPLAMPLLAAGVGLVVLNVFHHAWSDAATSILWWGSAGIILGSKS